MQRQRDDGTWRTLRTYRTQGARETRTINLGQGGYLVHVPAQHGYAQTFSDTTWLAR